jgi:hypothetical protein
MVDIVLILAIVNLVMGMMRPNPPIPMPPQTGGPPMNPNPGNPGPSPGGAICNCICPPIYCPYPPSFPSPSPRV